MSNELKSKMKEFSDGQMGGSLATQGENGPFVSFTFYAATDDLDIVFTASPTTTHGQNIQRDPRVAYLIDSRNELPDPDKFNRLVIMGAATIVEKSSPDYESLAAILTGKVPATAQFLEMGLALYRIRPSNAYLNEGMQMVHQALTF